MTALRPRPGSVPACAAVPSTASRNHAPVLRPLTKSPFSRPHSRTRTASAPRGTVGALEGDDPHLLVGDTVEVYGGEVAPAITPWRLHGGKTGAASLHISNARTICPATTDKPWRPRRGGTLGNTVSWWPSSTILPEPPPGETADEVPAAGPRHDLRLAACTPPPSRRGGIGDLVSAFRANYLHRCRRRDKCRQPLSEHVGARDAAHAAASMAACEGEARGVSPL